MKYQVWEEGYKCSGEEEYGNAHCWGEIEADSFRDACDKLLSKYSPTYNNANLTHWGCRLFDNEADARKSFG